MTRGMMNVRVIVTLLILVPYQIIVIWALIKGSLDIKSYLVGVSPFAGLVLKFWLDSSGDNKEQTP